MYHKELIYIAHRGNTEGSRSEYENKPNYLQAALEEGFHVECDIRAKGGELYLGHDEPQYRTNLRFLRQYGVWTHCKDVESLSILSAARDPFINFFYHEQDKFTITSKGFIWCYPRNIADGGIVVIPELLPESLIPNMYEIAGGICSDNIASWVNRGK